LTIERATAAGIGMVTDKAGIVGVEKPKRSVIQREAENRHVVGIHDAMREADGLPPCDQRRGSRNDFAQKRRVPLRIARNARNVRIEPRDRIVRDRFTAPKSPR
jgi:hypothetical protein